MRSFQFIALTPCGVYDPAIAIAGARADALGVFNCEHLSSSAKIKDAIATLVRYASHTVGLRISVSQQSLLKTLIADLPDQIGTLIFSVSKGMAIEIPLDQLPPHVNVLWEVTSQQDAQRVMETKRVDGLIAKGHEAGGWVGNETTYILLQRLLNQFSLPIYAYGGIGLHTAAASYAAGAAGVVLDYQFALAHESSLPQHVKEAVALMDGSETLCLGDELDRHYRVYGRPNASAVKSLQKIAIALATEADTATVESRWQNAIERQVGWGSLQQQVWPISQDAALAATLANRYKTVGGILTALKQAIEEHIRTAAELRPLDEESPLARQHGTRYPVVQGPMTRVSDRPEFALQVAQAGGLPFLALALMRGPEVETVLKETSELLGPLPWGVGILGFVPLDLRQEQMEAIRRVSPPFAIIAGGRPDQAKVLEQEGIPTYLHVPSPGLLRLFLKDGARRFIFEGRECGGHVGPRSSFVLWDSMCDVLLDVLKPAEAAKCSILFAGGIHDRRSAAMVAALAAPLAERGMGIGVLMGTAYLFTEEAVASGSIQPTFQQEALQCEETVLLESGPGHATRCAPTPFVDLFNQEKRRLQQMGVSAEEIRNTLEALNIGRLRIASKGVVHNSAYELNQSAPKYDRVDEGEQRRNGMYMIGQVAALRKHTCTMAELHHEVTVASSDFLAQSSREGASVREPIAQPSNVAIIGISTFLPKAQNVREFWSNVLDKVDAITTVPIERWDASLYFDPNRQAKDKIYSQAGGFLDDIIFNPLEFGIPPNSLRSIDPMHLLALLAARDALADAGYSDRDFDRSRTSVILGASGGTGDLGANYLLRSGLPLLFGEKGFHLAAQAADHLPEWTEDSFAGLLLNVAAGRIANRLDLGGLNFTVDAACASSLAAVHLAVKELETRSTDIVLVGGVDTVQNPFGYLCFSKTQALSPSGEPRVFDADGDGIVISEGVVMLVLKRLEDAERDGDRIYAVIQGVAGSSDGRAKGMTAPRPEGQRLALERAYAKAGFSPTTVGHFEAHGTGTVVGDQTEASTLTEFLEGAGARPQNHAIGSVKSMIGHTKATAGVAGMAKMAYALYHKVLPATLRVTRPNPKVVVDGGPLYINAETRPWLRHPGTPPRRAGVSAFGFGGTNFHAVLEEYTGDFLDNHETVTQRWPSELLLWPPQSRQALLAHVQMIEAALNEGAQPALSDLAYSLWQSTNPNREDAGLRLAIVASSIEDLRQKLAIARSALLTEGPIRLQDPRGVYLTDAPLAAVGDVAFLFPGQGSQYPNMLRDLAIYFAEVSETFEAMDGYLAEQSGLPLSRTIFPPSAFNDAEKEAQRQALTATHMAQPALGAANLALYRLLSKLGVNGSRMAGHSYGEYVALCVAGVFDPETLALLSAARGRAISETANGDLGTMAAVSANLHAIQPLIAAVEDIWIANLNAPGQVILSGSTEGIAQAVTNLVEAGVNARPIPVACAFHSPLVAPAQARLDDALNSASFVSPHLPVYSNTTGSIYPHDAQQIRMILSEHLVQPVRFTDEIEAMYKDGARIFVEVGPNKVLSGLVSRILDEQPHLAISLDSPHRHGLTQLQHALASLAAHGIPVDLARLFKGRSVRLLNMERLVAETQPEPLSPTVWLVNGARARSIQDAVEGPHRPPLADIIHTDLGHRVDGLATAQPANPQPVQPAFTYPHDGPRNQPSLTQPPTAKSVQQWKGVELADSQHETDAVLLSYQQTMERFLVTQSNVMLSFLTQTEDPAQSGGAPHLPPVNGANGSWTGKSTAGTITDNIRKRPVNENEGASAVHSATQVNDPPRSLMMVVDAPHLDRQMPGFSTSHLIMITDDGGGIANRLARRIRTQGGKAVVVTHAPVLDLSNPEHVCGSLIDPEGVAELVTSLRRTFGPIGGLIHLMPLQTRPLFSSFDLAAWQERLALETKSLFYLARCAADDLRAAGGGSGAWLISATDMGGSHGYGAAQSHFSPSQGGLNGLIKSLAQEWPTVQCKAIDLAADDDEETIVAHFLAEMAARDGLVEIGYQGSRRRTLQPAPQILDTSTPHIEIGADWVLLVTGGARGITAEVACDLAERYRPTIVLVGRSPLPSPKEAAATRGINEPAAIKTILIEQMRQSGQEIVVSAVEAVYQQLLKDREMRRNVARMQKAGATVHYYTADVRDAQAMTTLVEAIYRQYRRLDGVIHGAGIIEDKLIEEKTPASFDRVFNTKAESAFILSRLIRPDSLKFLAFFSSAAGAFGNRGQADYAATNEVVNKLALYLDRLWPGRIVSLNWGPWLKSGMVDAGLQEQFSRRNIQLIPIASGCHSFAQELRYGHKGESVVVLAGGEWGGQSVTHQQSSMQSATNGAAASQEPLPLLQHGTHRTRLAKGVEVIRTFDPANDHYLLDHIMDAKPVLPFAVVMEWMAECVQQSWPHLTVSGLRDLQVLQGIAFDNGPRSLRLVASPASTGPTDAGMDVTVEISDPDRTQRLLYRGIVELSANLSAPPQRSITGQKLQPFPLPLAEAYGRWLFHGPLFQGIQQIEGVSPTTMVALCRPSLPADCLAGNPAGSWLIDPVVFDSALQMIILWTRTYRDATPLPARFNRYRRFGTLSCSPVRCVLQVVSDPGQYVFAVDIEFFDAKGRMVGLLEGMECPSSKALNRLVDNGRKS